MEKIFLSSHLGDLSKEWWHSFLHIATRMCRARQCNGVLPRCTKGLHKEQKYNTHCRKEGNNSPNYKNSSDNKSINTGFMRRYTIYRKLLVINSSLSPWSWRLMVDNCYLLPLYFDKSVYLLINSALFDIYILHYHNIHSLQWAQCPYEY